MRYLPAGCDKLPDDVSDASLSTNFRWALLLPICFHGGGTEDDCWDRLQGFVNSVEETTSADDRALLDVYIALDRDDELFDTEEGKARLGSLFRTALGHDPIIYVQTAGWRHNICWLWDFLATEAIANGSEFFVLMGDDVRLTEPGWKEEVKFEIRLLQQPPCLYVGHDRGLVIYVVRLVADRERVSRHLRNIESSFWHGAGGLQR